MPITEADLDELMTATEAAGFLHVSRTVMYEIIRAEEIDVLWIGAGRGRARISKRAALDYLNRRTTRANGKRRTA